jgi:preprotein translocase subunit SecG
MFNIILIIHLLIAIALVITILLQRSEGGGLGMGGGMSGFMTGRSAANVLTRATAVLAALFMSTSLALALLAGGDGAPRSIMEQPAPVSQEPAKPAAPSAPLGQ